MDPTFHDRIQLWQGYKLINARKNSINKSSMLPKTCSAHWMLCTIIHKSQRNSLITLMFRSHHETLDETKTSRLLKNLVVIYELLYVIVVPTKWIYSSKPLNVVSCLICVCATLCWRQWLHPCFWLCRKNTVETFAVAICMKCVTAEKCSFDSVRGIRVPPSTAGVGWDRRFSG